MNSNIVKKIINYVVYNKYTTLVYVIKIWILTSS